MNLVTRSLIPTASLLALASGVAAQNSPSLQQQSLQQLEGTVSTLPQSGSSVGGFLNSARYEVGRGLTFRSQAGGSSMTVGGQVQAGYTWTEFNYDPVADPLNTVDSFSFGSAFSTDARLRVGGAVMDGKASYFVQMNPNGGGQGTDNLVDAWVGWQLRDNLNLRVGQQKMRSGLSADTSANDTDFETVARSSATNEFANLRATGVLFEGSAMDGHFNWHFGVANRGTARNTASQILQGAAGPGQGNDDTDVMVTAGASIGSFAGNSEDWSEGDLARSGSMQWITGATITTDNGSVANDNNTTINLFGGLKFGNGLAAQAEYWSREFDNAGTTDDGGYAQVSYTFASTGSMQPGFVARYGFVNLERPGADDIEGPEFTIGANAYYAAHNLKWQVEYASGTTENFLADDIESSAFRVLCTLVF